MRAGDQLRRGGDLARDVIERDDPDRNVVDDARATAASGLIFGVNMVVATTDGDTFSFNEIAGWLREAGFENPRALDAPGPSPLTLATKPAL